METKTNIRNERQYYIDWLRIILILSVFLFHIGMIFNTWDWHIKNDRTFDGALRNVMIFMHYWRMPLLFLVSGAGTWFALGRRSAGQYLGERAKRLIIPLIAGIFILVPVQVYTEKSSQYQSLLAYYPHMFEGIYPSGNFSWHHLWFIAYLFIISLMISPFLGFFKSEKFTGFIRRSEKFLNRPYALNIILVPLIGSQVLLRPYFPENTHDLVHDWAYIAYFIIFFLSGLFLLPNKNIAETIRKQRYLFLVETIISTVVMFRISPLLGSENISGTLWDVSAIILAWSCGLTAIGFSKQYFNRDSRLRKLANEAIYPFYLLHQPVIVILGSVMVKWDISVGLKAAAILVSSFALTVAVYWLVIRPFNVCRILFGMKAIKSAPVIDELKADFGLQATGVMY